MVGFDYSQIYLEINFFAIKRHNPHNCVDKKFLDSVHAHSTYQRSNMRHRSIAAVRFFKLIFQ